MVVDRWAVFKETLPIPKVPPKVRIFFKAVRIAHDVAKHEVEAGRISTPNLASPEILRYERSALASTRII